MEAFSLLKYWRGGGLGGGGGGGGGDNGHVNLRSKNENTTTIVTAIPNHVVETDDDDDVAVAVAGDDDGPFFDLEFAVPDDDGEEENKNDEENSSDEEEENDDVHSLDDGTDDGDEREFKFTLSSGSSNDRTDPNLTLSPSDDLFFKGRLVPIEPFNNSEQNSKPQFPVSLLKSATKFRVFMLGFKKSKTETNGSVPAPVPVPAPKQQQKPEIETREETTTTNKDDNNNNNNNNNKKDGNKFLTVKFKVEEVPIMSLFTRDNSSRSCSTNNKNSQKQNTTTDDSVSSDEKKFSKDVMQKYLKKVKPLYIRVSKRYGEKLRFSGQLSLGSGPKPAAAPAAGVVAQKSVKSTAEKSPSEAESAEAQVKSIKQGNNIPAGLRVVCKHLGKSRSASSAVAAAPPPPSSSRRDDSLLQQQDGIQSAILHCKRSFNASRDCESTILPRSVSDPSHEKSIDLSRKKSSHQGKLKECCDF